MIDHKTPSRHYPLPHIQNPGAVDVERLRQALTNIDSEAQALFDKTQQLQISKVEAPAINNLQQQIDDLSILIYAGLLL